MIGKLVRVPLREVWKREAADLTPWLSDNMDFLHEGVALNLSSAERERAAGSFSVDLIAEDESGNAIVIENQLEKSDHDHLGKLITYLTAIDARTAIWIVAHPRPEHVGAITWLNESSSAFFYLVKAEAIRIDDSRPAPLLTLIVGPSEDKEAVGDTKKDFADRELLRHRFWASLLDRANARTPLHANTSPGYSGWIAAGAGRSGLSYNYVARQHDARVELYIDKGKGARDDNKAIFDELKESKSAIEEAFGGALDWQRLDAAQSCRITKPIDLKGYRDELPWDETQDAMIDAMIRLEKALKPHINALKV